jgi:hypothetical protein
LYVASHFTSCLAGTVGGVSERVDEVVDVASRGQRWLCITGASPPQHLAVFRGSTVRDGTAWLSEKWQPERRWGEESGLQACYRKTPQLRGFPILRGSGVRRCHDDRTVS